MVSKSFGQISPILSVFIGALMVSATCGTGPVNPALPEDWSQAIQLKKGNYWIFESKTIQLQSNAVATSQNDSTFIAEDSLLENNRYYKLENSFGLARWIRDSSGCLVEMHGKIEFSAANTADTLFNESGNIGFMGGRVEKIKVPAGVFSTVFFYIIQKAPAGLVNQSNNPTFYDEDHVIVSKVWYAKQVGVVKSVFYYSNSTAFERNLIRYKLK